MAEQLERVKEQLVERAWEHLHHLAVEIGPRPSTREGERVAARYALRVLTEAGLQNVREEPFLSGRETYWPYVLSLGVGLLGNVTYLSKPNRTTGALAAVLNALGAWGFYAEANFEDHWARALLPKGVSQNVIGVIPARGERRHRVVLMAHIDTHRTPIFYSTPWLLRLFSSLVGAAFISLPLSALLSFLRLFAFIPGVSGVLGLATAFQAFALGMSIQGETTPYTPGANDNGSGAATVLALAEYLVKHPLSHTEVWIVLTGCEEVGAYGADAFARAHGKELEHAFIINVDMVGVGVPTLVEREGLIKSYHPDPELFRLAMEVAAEHPELTAGPRRTGAYTDAGVLAKHGLRPLTVDSVVPPGHPAEQYMGYWHQTRDTFDNVERECVAKACGFVWLLLQRINER